MKSVLKKLQHLWAFLYFCIASVFMTWPLALHLKTSVIGGMGDNIYFVWLIRWYQKILSEGNGQLFFNPWMNYPEGWNLSTTETTLSSALPGVPFSWLFGPVAGYNLAMLITFFLSGFFMYLWVRSLTKSTTAGLLAGTLYAFSPYHMAHFVIGHLNLCGIQWFPLFFWGVYNLLSGKGKFDWKSVLLTGLSLGLIAFTSMYYLYMTLIFTAVFIFSYLCFTRFKILGNKWFWLQSISAGIVSSPFLYYALLPFVKLSISGTLEDRSMKYASMYSASPTDFFIPSSDHFIFGRIFGNWFDRSLWIESSLYIGLVALTLAVVALVIQKKSLHRWFIWSALIVIMVSFVLGLGINLHWNNQEVVVQVPAFLQSVIHKTETLVYLPAAWLFMHLPFFEKMRAIMRFGFYVLLFMPVLAGIGFSHLQQKLTPRKKIIFFACLLALVFFEIYPGSYAYALSQPQPRAVDIWLAEQPDQGAVVQMPFMESIDQAQIYYTLYYEKPFIGGFFNANQPEQYQRIYPILKKFPDVESVIQLQELGVKYIVVDTAAYSDDPSFTQNMDALGLVLLTTQDDQAVYTLPAP